MSGPLPGSDGLPDLPPLDRALRRPSTLPCDRRKVVASPLLGQSMNPGQFSSITGSGIIVGLMVHQDPLRKLDGICGVYSTPRGTVKGLWHGSKTLEQPELILARPGYAVGGLKVPNKDSLGQLTVIFMHIDGNRLNPADTYEATVGKADPVPSGATGLTISTKGEFLVGLCGQTARSPNGELAALGFLVLKPEASAPNK